jgi:hypothetical protein
MSLHCVIRGAVLIEPQGMMGARNDFVTFSVPAAVMSDFCSK